MRPLWHPVFGQDDDAELRAREAMYEAREIMRYCREKHLADAGKPANLTYREIHYYAGRRQSTGLFTSSFNGPKPRRLVSDSSAERLTRK